MTTVILSGLVLLAVLGSLPEAASAVEPHQIPPLLFRGQPFFVNATFNAPNEADLQEWLHAGGNTVVFHVPGPDTPAIKLRQSLEESAAWAAKYNVAAIYYPVAVAEQGAIHPEKRPAMVEHLRRMLAVTAKHPQTLGYWTMDEPENAFYEACKSTNVKNKDLAKWIVSHTKWVYDTLKEGDPDAYVMPTIAWWTMYEALAPLYDVNVPNEYPTYKKDAPLTGPLYNVVYDAAKAADAVRIAHRKSFVYMPGIFDTMPRVWRAATLEELQYLYFAPITQGARGVMSWRLGYCSLPYRRAVVYPVMRQLDRLTPWLLGQWCNEKVASDHDQPTVAYLKEFPVRVRTVADEAAAPTEQVPGVPDCSHVLRRRPNGSYLLLAVNNRKEPLKMTFRLRDIPGLPTHASEILESRSVRIDGPRIRDEFKPFGVHAYIIEPN
jgi:hypothetical protein